MTFRLPRLPAGVPIVDPKTGLPTTAFLQWWDEVLTVVESHITTLEVEALAASLAAATAAAAASAATANTAAATANTAATNAAAATAADARFLSISNSTTTTAGGIPLLTGADAPPATITVANHTRHYADGTSVAVTGGSIAAGLAYSTQYFVYYDQPSLAGGAVVYDVSTTGPPAQTTAAGGAHPDRHYVGSVVTPAALGAPINGAGAVGVTFDQPIGGNWL